MVRADRLQAEGHCHVPGAEDQVGPADGKEERGAVRGEREGEDTKAEARERRGKEGRQKWQGRRNGQPHPPSLTLAHEAQAERCWGEDSNVLSSAAELKVHEGTRVPGAAAPTCNVLFNGEMASGFFV